MSTLSCVEVTCVTTNILQYKCLCRGGSVQSRRTTPSSKKTLASSYLVKLSSDLESSSIKRSSREGVTRQINNCNFFTFSLITQSTNVHQFWYFAHMSTSISPTLPLYKRVVVALWLPFTLSISVPNTYYFQTWCGVPSPRIEPTSI